VAGTALALVWMYLAQRRRRERERQRILAQSQIDKAERLLLEEELRRRQEQLRAEVRMLEQRKRDSIERLQEIAALVQDVLPSRPDDSLVGDLKPERQAQS